MSAGDSRHSAGAVSGFGMLVAPGITLNTSIDQSHTNINVMGQPQRAAHDLTQIGVSGAIETGRGPCPLLWYAGSPKSTPLATPHWAGDRQATTATYGVGWRM